MDTSRRKFLKIAGCSVALIGGKPVFEALTNDLAAAEPVSLGQALKGGRWAMVVDLRKCMEKPDCNVCADACHKVHNVPTIDDPQEEVKWIWKEKFENAFAEESTEYLKESLKNKPTLVFCNHCDNPPCVRVCPTQSTWKREDGIVMMDMHRCIGCRYCIVACPYGSRSFNFSDPRKKLKKEDVNLSFPTRSKGVVEKCNFCAERLARGQKPKCVESCPEKAMYFGDLRDPNSEVRRLIQENFTIRRKPGLGTNPHIFYIV